MAEERTALGTADIEALRRFAEAVIGRADADGLEVKAVTLALLGGLLWQGDPGSAVFHPAREDAAHALTVAVRGRLLAFRYNHQVEAIEMRQGAPDGRLLHTFRNRGLVDDFERAFARLWHHQDVGSAW